LSVRWLVDGMNVIGSRPDGWWRDRDKAKRTLIEALREFAAESGEPVAVVFDGRPIALPDPDPVTVEFAPTPGPNAADAVLAARVEADGDPAGLRVVTSDRALADRVRAAGAEVIPAGSFRRRLDGR
jgi:predicted RNA-binding protein with PIN domain